MKLRVELPQNSYDIIIEKNILKRIDIEIKEIFSGEKIFILTDENVDKYYGEKVYSILEKAGYNVKKMVVEAGEKSKSFSSLQNIYNELLDFKFTRTDLIITLGGGVIGDLGGFVASTFLRGVAFVQVPTSLLAQVDSSVGGKVGVDLERGKNLVGSFYQPKRVIIDPMVLESLEDRFFYDGMAEVIKYGCIKDKELFFNLLSYKNKSEVMKNIEYIIYTCCKIKKEVVENDEKDTGERMILNFGHTIGHGIEQYYNYEKYTHGEGVAIGMYEITRLGEKLGETEEKSADLIREILIKYKLPYKLDVEMEELKESISLDKKKFGKKLNLIFISEIGKSKIVQKNL